VFTGASAWSDRARGYDGSVTCDLRIVFSSIRYGSSDGDDAPEVAQDQHIDTYYVEYRSAIERGVFNSGGGGLTSLEDAMRHAEPSVADLKWIESPDPPSSDPVARFDDVSDGQQCPCCGHRTLRERAAFEICPVCFWEDDGQDDPDADVVRGGPNRDLSLSRARENYRRIGACCEQDLPFVRSPLPEEL